MADGSGKKGKKCGKGYVSAKKKCKATFRQAVSSQPPLVPKKEEPKKEEAKKGMSALAIASAIGLGAVGIGAAGLGIAALSRGSGSSGEGLGAGSALGRERQGAKGWGHPRSFGKTGWVAPGNLSRSEVERILTPIEEGIREKDREWVAVVDGKTGQILTPPTGGTHTGQVELPDTAMRGNAIITHNHPDVPWVDGSRSDGGPLSPGDVEAALTFRAEIRAVSSKGTYSLRVDWSKMEDWEARAARGEDPDGLADIMLSQYKRVPRRHEEMLAEAAQKIRDDLLAGRPVPSPHEIGHKALLDLAEEFKSLGLIYEAKERRFTADSASPRISSLGTTQACAQIRADAKKTVVNKGKRCPGGYWIPRQHTCGGEKEEVGLRSPNTRKKVRLGIALGVGIPAGLAAIGVGGYLTYLGAKKQISANPEDYRWPTKMTDQEIEDHYSKLEPGDLIRQAFYDEGTDIYMEHYAVYVGKDPKTGKRMVVENEEAGRGLQEEGSGIGIHELMPDYAKHFDDASLFQKVETPPPSPKEISEGAPQSREEILARAEAMVGRPHNFHMYTNNCETIARAIVQGKEFNSTQAGKNIIGRVVVRWMGDRRHKPYWVEGGLSGKQMVAELNQGTLERRKQKADSLIDAKEKSGEIPSIDTLVEEMAKFKGNVGDEMKISILTEWLMLVGQRSGLQVLRQSSTTENEGRLNATTLPAGLPTLRSERTTLWT